MGQTALCETSRRRGHIYLPTKLSLLLRPSKAFWAPGASSSTHRVEETRSLCALLAWPGKSSEQGAQPQKGGGSCNETGFQEAGWLVPPDARNPSGHASQRGWGHRDLRPSRGQCLWPRPWKCDRGFFHPLAPPFHPWVWCCITQNSKQTTNKQTNAPP